MDEELEILLVRHLSRIADALERLANGGEDFEPNYQFSLDDYAGFDWQGINAEIVQSDEFGPTHVRHGGLIYTRRSPQNKFGEALWFSRPHGRDTEGNVKYLRLVTFKKVSQAEPLPGRVADAVSNGKKNGGTNHTPGPRLLDHADYLVEAAKLNFVEKTADAIAQVARVTGDDYSIALPFLAYFAQAKRSGLTFDLAKKHLVSLNNDPQQAIARLEIH